MKTEWSKLSQDQQLKELYQNVIEIMTNLNGDVKLHQETSSDDVKKHHAPDLQCKGGGQEHTSKPLNDNDLLISTQSALSQSMRDLTSCRTLYIESIAREQVKDKQIKTLREALTDISNSTSGLPVLLERAYITDICTDALQQLL
jgi:hypothetical protein